MRSLSLTGYHSVASNGKLVTCSLPPPLLEKLALACMPAVRRSVRPFGVEREFGAGEGLVAAAEAAAGGAAVGVRDVDLVRAGRAGEQHAGERADRRPGAAARRGARRRARARRTPGRRAPARWPARRRGRAAGGVGRGVSSGRFLWLVGARARAHPGARGADEPERSRRRIGCGVRGASGGGRGGRGQRDGASGRRRQRSYRATLKRRRRTPGVRSSS